MAEIAVAGFDGPRGADRTSAEPARSRAALSGGRAAMPGDPKPHADELCNAAAGLSRGGVRASRT